MHAEPVVIVDYDPKWTDEFAQIAAVIGAHLGDLVCSIEHVGSTAVPGLASKPILDFDVVIDANPTQRRWEAIVNRLSEIGYVHVGDRGIPTREAFDRRDARVPYDGSNRTWSAQHLYVCATDSRELRRHLAFRDALRAKKAHANQYADLKRTLAMQFGMDRDGYSEAKSTFIEDVLATRL